MTVKLQRPILMGGIALMFGIWALDAVIHTLGDWTLYAVVASTVGAGAWWMQRQPSPVTALSAKPRVVDAATVQRTLVEVERVMTQLQAEAEDSDPSTSGVDEPRLSRLRSQIGQIATGLQREQIQVVVMGAKGSGKTALIQRLHAAGVSSFQRLTLTEAPSFSAATAAGLTADALALQQAIAADLVLFVITGDITESELQTVQRVAAEKRTVVVFNKQDQFLPGERDTILTRLHIRMQGLVPEADVAAIAAAPKPLKVRQHQADGSVKEWLEERAPEIASLTQRLDQIVQQECQQLVLATSLGNAVFLKTQVKTVLNDLRRTRAVPVVEQFQWIAAATAFASPVPTLDVLATAAINAQMVLDLGKIYRQKFSLQHAQQVASMLGTLILKLGLVELSTRTIASLLKTNAVTYVAGGCIQGVSAAYLTRIAGLSLIEYFNTQEPNLTLAEANPLVIERFSQILQAVFQRNQQIAFLQSFVMQAINRLAPEPARPQLSASLKEPLRLQQPEAGILDQNKASVRLSIPSLDSTSLPSN